MHALKEDAAHRPTNNMIIDFSSLLQETVGFLLAGISFSFFTVSQICPLNFFPASQCVTPACFLFQLEEDLPQRRIYPGLREGLESSWQIC